MKNNQKNSLYKARRTTFMLGAILFISLFMMSFASATIYETHTDGIDNQIWALSTASWAQTFTIGTVGTNVSHNLKNITLQLYKSGTLGTCNISILNTDATGQPVAPILDSITFDGDALSESATNYTYTFTENALLLAGYKYAIVYLCPSGGNMGIKIDASSPTYTGGSMYTNAGGITNWGSSNNYDAFFIENGEIDTFSGIYINLITPANNSIVSTSTQAFNTSMTITGGATNWNWTNATTYLWFSNGTLFNYTVKGGLTGNTTSAEINISGLVLGNYLWNTYACYSNATFGNCSWGVSNFSLQYRPFSFNGQTYTESIYETSSQIYTANITTIPSILTVISKLNYNGTLYSATTSCASGICNIRSSFDIPLITSETQNKTSYWNITVYDGTSSYSYNTLESNFTQNVTRIHLEYCNATYPVNSLNFTAWDEKNLSRINLFSFSGTFQTWLGTGSIYRNQSFKNVSTPTYNLCIAPNQTFYTNAQMRYAYNNDDSSYITRDYYFQNKTISNSSQNIYLYLLTAEDSTTFIIKVQDQKLSGVEDALVYIYRYYPEDGTYKVVSISMTDSNGETIGFYETEIADYKHIIMKNGVVLLETSPQKVVGKEVPFTLTFTVGTALSYPWEVFEDNPNIETSLGYNDTTKLVSYTYVDSTEETSFGRLLVIQLSKSNSTYSVVCNTTSSEPSATITCDMSSYDEGNFVAYGYIEGDVASVYSFEIYSGRDFMGRDGLLAGLFIILVCGFAFIWNPTAGIIGIETGIILTNVIGLIAFSPIFIFASLALAILAIILVRS